MALRRRKIKNNQGEFIINPVKCSICKEKKAFMTVHGSYRYGGHTCCDDCWTIIKIKEEKIIKSANKQEMSEADYQTWNRLY